MPAPDVIADRDLLAGALREAGEIARRYYGGVYKSWNKSRGNPVTEADIEIDRFLRRTLSAARTGYGWLSEETEDNPERLSRETLFIVDPIDGTYGFLKQRPQFTIVAAVVHMGRPVSGAIFNPITDEMFVAAIGCGARKNNAEISVSTKQGFDCARLLAEKKLIDPSRWATPWPKTIIAETRASAAYRLALVAAGEFDATFSLSAKSDWDLAAGDLLIREAGGMVTNDQSDPIIYNQANTTHRSVVCAGPALHGQLIARLRDYRGAR